MFFLLLLDGIAHT